ncbi:general secretion pathway protein N [Gammaproteobacteria bacterium]
MIRVSTRILVFLGLLGYLGSLVLQLPVTRILTWVEPLPGQIRVYGAEGTAFAGGAALIGWNNWRFESVTWALRPWDLIMGKLGFDVAFHNPDESKAHTRAGITILGHPYLTDLHARLRVSALEPLWRPTVVNFGGWLGIDLDHLKGTSTNFDLAGQVAFENIAWEGKPPIPLGDFLVILETLNIVEEAPAGNSPATPNEAGASKDGIKGNVKGKRGGEVANKGGIEANVTGPTSRNATGSLPPSGSGHSHRILHGKITDRSGPVQVQGQLWLNSQGIWQITGAITPRPNSQPQIRQILSLLGSPDQSGRFPVSLAGRLGEY